MSTPTNTELLNLVKTAIQTRLNGGTVESYAIGNRNLRYTPLSELLKLKRDLEEAVASESGGARNYVSFKRPV